MYCLGYLLEFFDLKKFSVMMMYFGYIDVNFMDIENNIIYSIVWCMNYVGFIMYVYFDGIKIF